MKNTKEDKWLAITFSGTDAAGIRLLYVNTLQGVRPYYLKHFMWENRSQVYETEFQEGEEMGNPMTDDFLSFIVFIFKVLFLKTLKF